MLRSRLSLFLLAPTLALAIDDLPVYLDAGCDSAKTTGGLNNGYAQGPADMVTAPKSNGTKTVPVTCTDKLNGTDAVVVKLARTLGNGEYWDFELKFADDRAHNLKGFKELHVWVKNNLSTAAKFRLGWESAASSTPPMKNVSIPGGGTWTEYVYSMTADVPCVDSSYGLKLSQPTNASDYGPIDILIDSVYVTDGTGKGSLSVPAVMTNPVPANWGTKFLLGSFDNRALGSSKKSFQAGMAYRYQYVMPETRNYYSRSGKGYLYDYAMESDSLGVKTAMVWYNLGKMGEGYTAVTANLLNATTMSDYFDRYDWALNQLVLAGQSDYIIVLEPDMYGFLMRGPGGATGTPVTDPTSIKVDMTKANSLSGKTYEPNMVGWAKYMVARARQKLTKGVIIGHMPNHWGVSIPGQVGQGRKESHYISGLAIGTFLAGFGPDGLGDAVFVEKSDHDAGHKPSNENWFWDSTSYSKYFLWTRLLAWKTGLPICGWQVSEGNMANPQTWKDDAVQTFLSHPQWWMDGGFAGILFGAGNQDCVNFGAEQDTTAGFKEGWFVHQMTAYMANQVSLPIPSSVAPHVAKPAVAGLRCVARPGGLLLSGWKGEAEVTLADLSGRVVAHTRIHDGQFLSIPGSLSGMRLVHVKAADGFQGTRVVALP